MIVFDLICSEHHRFEGWFASGDDFTSQQSRGLLNCPVCGGAHVDKLPAAKISKQLPEPVASPPSGPARQAQGEQIDISRIIDYVLTHTEDVGKKFAEEARKIHHQEAPQRSIRGVAQRSRRSARRRDSGVLTADPAPGRLELIQPAPI